MYSYISRVTPKLNPSSPHTPFRISVPITSLNRYYQYYFKRQWLNTGFVVKREFSMSKCCLKRWQRREWNKSSIIHLNDSSEYTDQPGLSSLAGKRFYFILMNHAQTTGCLLLHFNFNPVVGNSSDISEEIWIVYKQHTIYKPNAFSWWYINY